MQSRPAHYNTRYKHDLTPKQTAVLDLMAQGRTNAEIAERLGLTLDGAKWHVSEILGKLGMESREDAIEWWRRYRRLPARVRRIAMSAIGWLMWKPAAIGGGALAVVAAAGLGFFVVRGGEGAQAFEDLPACTQENLRSSSTTESIDGVVRYTYSLSLREGDWYEGIFKTLHLSDRDVISPCRLDTTARVQVGTAEPIPDWPADRGPAPLKSLKPVEAEPDPFPEVRIRTPLRSGAATTALVVEIANWCKTGELPGISLLVANMDDPHSALGILGPLEQSPACADESGAVRLMVTATDSPNLP